MRALLVALALVGACKEHGSITAAPFTVYPMEGACVVVADLVSTRDSSNVDITLRAFAGDRCSAPSREMTEGPFTPKKAKSIKVELAACPEGVDRIDVAIHRWGSTNNWRHQGVVDSFEKKPSDGGGCDVLTRLHIVDPVADTLAFLVARDAEGRPLDRTLPFPVPQAANPHQDTSWFAPACDRIAAVEIQVVN